MAMIYQIGRPEKTIEPGAGDLFIETDDGSIIRIVVERNGLVILPINGIQHDIVVRHGHAGVKISSTHKIKGRKGG